MARDIGCLRISRERRQQFAGGGRQSGQRVGRGARRQREKPGALDADALAHEAGFAEYAAHFGEFGGIAAIEGRQSVRQRGGHRSAGS